MMDRCRGAGSGRRTSLARAVPASSLQAGDLSVMVRRGDDGHQCDGKDHLAVVPALGAASGLPPCLCPGLREVAEDLEPGQHARRGMKPPWGEMAWSSNFMLKGSAVLCSIAFTRWVTVDLDESTP